ncbi:MAG: ketoacyl-ACP synthase III [Fibromonadaceae bacterium]|jgi:3-oxoacyl-[acyl-carrier-protein] synthase-3|nr:ketoacyl-ACP synthase III [Fibromonadaceae bacterium]
MNAAIKSIGVYLPEFVAKNDDLAKMKGLDTNDEWIASHTGIRERRLVQDSSLTTADIGFFAAKDAIEKAGISPKEIDGIIAGTMSPDKQFPGVSCYIQAKLGCEGAFAFDITAACGFIPPALNTAALMIRSGQAKNILVVGAEISSRIMDWSDRNTCVLFGDGAAAILLSASDDGNKGFVGAALAADGNLTNILYLNTLGAEASFLRMEGTAVYKLAVSELAAITQKALENAGLSLADIDLLVPHQANIRIIQSVGKRLKLAPEKVMVNVDKYGNTSSASIPIALHEAQQQGRLKPGMLVAMPAIGGGMNWGCVLFRW